MTLNDVKYPICPMSMYFEGDEDKIDQTKCDYDMELRGCSEACKKPPKKRIGFIDDITGATLRVEILDETKETELYVVRRQVYHANLGEDFKRHPYGEVFLVSKDKVKNIKEE